MCLHSPQFYLVNNIRDEISSYICPPLPPVPAGILPNTGDNIIDPFTPHSAAIQNQLHEVIAKAEETRNTTKQKKNKDVVRNSIESTSWYSTDDDATIQYMPQNAADILDEDIMADKKRAYKKRKRSDGSSTSNGTSNSKRPSTNNNIHSSTITSSNNGIIDINNA